jgi:glycosyltransferase involved in cell wall biosynthesis
MTPTVLVDVRRNSWAPEYGISRYSRNLVRSMIALAPSDLQIRPIDLPGTGNWAAEEAVTVAPAGHDLVSRFRQEQIGMRRLGAELLHLPWYEGPLAPRLPHVVSVHDLDTLVGRRGYNWRFRTYYNTLLRAYVRTAARVIAPSDVTAEAIRNRWPRAPVEVVHIGVDPVFVARQPHELKPGRIVYSGGYGPRKRIADLIGAFDRLARDRPEIELVMTAVPSPEAWALIRGSRSADRVRPTGFLGDDALAALYRSAEMVVYPSLLEGFGLPLVEAFASGTPVVATRTGSIPEIAGDAALLVEVGDVDALADGIASLLDGPELAASLVRAGMDRAVHYGSERAAALMLGVYREVLSL